MPRVQDMHLKVKIDVDWPSEPEPKTLRWFHKAHHVVLLLGFTATFVLAMVYLYLDDYPKATFWSLAALGFELHFAEKRLAAKWGTPWNKGDE